MKYEQLLQKFKELSNQRSSLMHNVAEMDNDIVSISERIDELKEIRANGGSDKETHDQISRARDKRKRVRSDVAHAQHEIRKVETEIAALKMRFKWLVDYEVKHDE